MRIEMRDISKAFGSNQVLEKCSVTIDVRPQKSKRRFLDMIRVPPLTKKGTFS